MRVLLFHFPFHVTAHVPVEEGAVLKSTDFHSGVAIGDLLALLPA